MRESLGIGQRAIVESERLLIEVTEQVERLHRHIRALDGALQQRPQVFASVGVHVPVDVRHGVVDDVVRVVWGQPDIRGDESV